MTSPCITFVERSAYIDYKNGKADSWRMERVELADRSEFLISKYLFCYGRKHGQALREVFVGHIAEVCPESMPRVTIVGPRRSERGKENMIRLGASHIGTSAAKFPLYEVDLRRDGEPNPAAQALLVQVKTLLGKQ